MACMSPRYCWLNVQCAFAHSCQQRSEIVAGRFADHAYINPHYDAAANAYSMCEGNTQLGIPCFYFTDSFTKRFVTAHNRLLTHTQNVLAATTGGPVICAKTRCPKPSAVCPRNETICAGLWFGASWTFQELRDHTAAGTNGSAPYVIEASFGGGCNFSAPRAEAKLAAHLCAMEKYTYLTCFSEAVPPYSPIWDKPLGECSNGWLGLWLLPR